MDKTRVAEAIRKHLERRLAAALKCEPQDFRNQKLGSLVHLCFLAHGDGESIGGFFSTIQAVLDLIGSELTWAQPIVESEENVGEKKEEVIN